MEMIAVIPIPWFYWTPFGILAKQRILVAEVCIYISSLYRSYLEVTDITFDLSTTPVGGNNLLRIIIPNGKWKDITEMKDVYYSIYEWVQTNKTANEAVITRLINSKDNRFIDRSKLKEIFNWKYKSFLN